MKSYRVFLKQPQEIISDQGTYERLTAFEVHANEDTPFELHNGVFHFLDDNQQETGVYIPIHAVNFITQINKEEHVLFE